MSTRFTDFSQQELVSLADCLKERRKKLHLSMSPSDSQELTNTALLLEEVENALEARNEIDAINLGDMDLGCDGGACKL